MPKTPAQLDREIAEALASKDKPTTWMQRKSLYAQGEPSGCDTFLLTYLPYHEMEPYKSSSAYGYGSYEECFDTRELAQRRLQQLRKEDRIEWAKIYQDDPRYPMGRKLVDEWNEGDRDDLAHARIKQVSKRPKAARSHSTIKSDAPATWLKVDDVVQFRSEPGTGGVIRRFDYADDGSWAWVATPRGERRVSIEALRRVRKEHEQRVRRSVGTKR